MIRRIFLIVTVVFTFFVLQSMSQASEGFEDLVKVVRSGVTEEALLTYINDSPIAYDLSVDEILYLRDLGLSPEAITAVINHGKKLGAQTSVTGQVAEPESAAAAPEQPQEPVIVEAPDSQGVVQETIVDAPVVTAPPEDSADYSTFYNALSPYGTWIDIDGVWYWQPTAVRVVGGWRPYRDCGHWVCTDLGWMWQSSYSWGWAPFHYGRWRLHPRHGWIWRPDSIWAPAWVAWRECDAAIGWAPLPPDACFAPDMGFTYLGRGAAADCEFGLDVDAYIFVPVLDFCSSSLVRHCLSRPDAARLFGTTGVIRNGLTFTKNRLVNNGPLVTHLIKQIGQDIKPVRVIDNPVRTGGRIVSGVLKGESVAVYRPHVAPASRETPDAVIARRQADAGIRLERARPDAVINMYRSPAEVRMEQARGWTSLTATRQPAVPGNPPQPAPPVVVVPPSNNDIDQQNEALKAAARRRQVEEVAEQQRQAEQQRAEAFARAQELQRQQSADVQRNQAIVEQQRQVEQRASSQEAQRQAQQALQQREEQMRAIQVQRQTEEATARLREAHQQQVESSPRPQSGFQGYENRAATSSASSRGSASRGKGENDRQGR